MGGLCCTKSFALRPESNSQTKFYITLDSTILFRNYSLFNSVYDLNNEKLGFGSYGDVKLCIDKHLLTEKAVKILNKDYLRSANIDNSWFYNQISLLNRLDHPLIIHFHEYYEDRDYFYLVMDYSKEGDLLKYLKTHQNLKELDICSIINKLLIAVAYMHNRKIAHRDIKLENILVFTNDGVSIKIIDFDTIACFGNNFLTGAIGTYQYMAPETIDKAYDERCDIWSCGIVMHTLLTKKFKLPGFTDFQTPNKLFKLNLDFSKLKVSSAAQDLLKKLLQKNPAKRLSALEALKHPWFDLIRQDQNDEVYKFLYKLINTNENELLKALKGLFINSKATIDSHKIEKIFLYLDKDYDGELTKPDFFDVFITKHKPCDAEAFAGTIMTQIHKNNDSRIKYSEFLKTGIEKTVVIDPKNLKHLFESLSENENQSLEVQNIEKRTSQGIGMKKEDLKILVDYIKKHNIDKINFEKFKDMIIEGVNA